MESFKLSTIIFYKKTKIELIDRDFNQLRTNGFGMEPMLRPTLLPSAEQEFFFSFFSRNRLLRSMYQEQSWKVNRL